MLPGLRSPTGQLYVTAGPPSASDPRMAGFALKPTGEVYVAGGAAPWSPADLFANDEEGVWFDPSDLSTMFQDAEGTVPVTADGQPVGLILDKSGNGNHASQTTAAARPLHKTDGTYHWLQFDGVDDLLNTSSVNLSGTDKVFVAFGGLRASSGGGLVYTQDISTGFAVLLTGANGGFRADLKNTTKLQDLLLENTKVVYTVSFDAAGVTAEDEIKVRKDGVPTGTVNSAGPTSGNQANQPLAIGNWIGAAPLAGNVYPLIVRGTLCTPEEIINTETWVNSKTGAY